MRDNRPTRSLRRTTCIAALAMISLISACGGPTGPPVRVIVPRGATFRAAADSMASAGVIDVPLAFRVYARARGLDRQIQAGTYLLRRGTRWSDLLRAMNGGTGVINRITIPEGFSIAQITPVLVRALGVTPDSVAVAVRDSGTRARLNDPAETLEGYLFPDTYVFAPGASAREAVAEMVKRFEREWTPHDDSVAQALGHSRHEIVTMASIVEKEARVPAERPVIAAVYYNRLKDGMLLQADPTIQYVLGRHTERVLYKDLTIESPYNTYIHFGLPPGPIASPGGASIRAALAPANVPYLYFVAAPDGHHEFRTSLAAHEQAKRAIKAEKAAAEPKASSSRAR
ncbi:MAG: endolytic transglycosylase MltG [Gemmatimonadaceae bacterium]